MARHDPISDFLTRIRNAKDARHRYVDVYTSKAKVNILKVLQEQGFIDHYIENNENGKVRVFLKYSAGRKPVIQGLVRKSKPSLRRYLGYDKIPKVLGGMGVAIISTSRGVMDGEAARQQKVGGEILCFVW